MRSVTSTLTAIPEGRKDVHSSTSILADVSPFIWVTMLDVRHELLVYLIVAAIVGFVAESLVGWRLPFGFVGAIIAALVGICC